MLGPRGGRVACSWRTITAVKGVLFCLPVSSRPGGIMTASLPDHERWIQCPYCSQKYLLVWDDQEWNSVKDWIRVAEAAVRKSHRAHGDIALPLTLKVHP